MPHDITDRERYLSRMNASIIDKIFFLDKIEGDVLVDFGCADGSLLKTISVLFPHYKMFGYDIDSEMICNAQKENTMNIVFTSDWSQLVENITHARYTSGNKTTLILNSVIHEVYSYGSKTQIDEFWKRVWDTGFDYVVIRDMCVSRTTSRPSDPLSVTRIRQLFDSRMLGEWESIWGNLNENWSLVHFLLTYQYTDNWERESRENYLPVNYEDMLGSIPYNYVPIFAEHYTLPYLRRKVMKDFGIQLQDRTHLKLILERCT
jgi:hypothetical protein